MSTLYHQNDIGLRLERYIWVVENLNCCKRCFAGFLQELLLHREDSANAFAIAHACSSATSCSWAFICSSPERSFGKRVL